MDTPTALQASQQSYDAFAARIHFSSNILITSLTAGGVT